MFVFINTDKPSGQPQIIASPNANEIKHNSYLELTCDVSNVNGSLTWYKWMFENGTEIQNKTEAKLVYKVKTNEEMLHFVCTAGNPEGQIANSMPWMIKIIHDTPSELLYNFFH